jgi:hypothetical protein
MQVWQDEERQMKECQGAVVACMEVVVRPGEGEAR